MSRPTLRCVKCNRSRRAKLGGLSVTLKGERHICAWACMGCFKTDRSLTPARIVNLEKKKAKAKS